MRPVEAQPGHTEADVEAALQSGQFVFTDCYTIEPLVGDAMRFTNAQRRVSVVPYGEVSRAAYEANQVLITGLRIKNNLGVEVDQQTIQLDYTQSPTFQGYLTWPNALITGRLDGARVRRDRYIATEWGTTTDWLGGMPMFNGVISNLSDVGQQSATLNVKSDLVLLNMQMPRDLYEANCKNTWGDPICGVDQSDWAVSTTALTGSTRTKLNWAGASKHYELGKIHVENGDAVVRVRTVSRVVPGVAIYLAYPLDFDPITSQAFTIYPGCPRNMDDTYGCPKYHVDWEQHFKGFPFIPVAETAI